MLSPLSWACSVPPRALGAPVTSAQEVADLEVAECPNPKGSPSYRNRQNGPKWTEMELKWTETELKWTEMELKWTKMELKWTEMKRN